MAEVELAQPVTAAGEAVEHACRLFEDASPAAMAAGSAVLGQALTELEACRRAARGNVRDPLLAAKLRQLRAALRQAGSLLESAADFYRGWERILGALSGGYMPGGQPAPVARGGRLSCQG